jgi:predicted component of viral defense system (DUF524 family)
MSDSGVDAVEVALKTSNGEPKGTLIIKRLPRTKSFGLPQLLDYRDNFNRDDDGEAIQLLEGVEYRYSITSLENVNTVTCDHPEIFESDEFDGTSGRLKPRMYVGTLRVRFALAGDVCEIGLEVRSKKIEYRTQYRWMLRDIAEEMSEAVMERFAAPIHGFEVDDTANAKTLYQRLAFLQSLMKDEAFVSAMNLVVNRPHIEWQSHTETRDVSRGIRAHSRLARQFSRPGPRHSTAILEQFQFVPMKLESTRSEETVDNPPNRFVKFAITKWREDVYSVVRALSNEKSTAPVKRGLREASDLLARLDELLALSVFRNVGRLSGLPSSNPVLLRKPGYREIAAAYVQLEMAAKMGWNGGEDVYAAGKRDVATLYEFWCFIQLAKCLSNLCEQPLDFGRLLTTSEHGLNLVLARGNACALSGKVRRYRRELECQLWFNRSFSPSDQLSGSWSRRMRPDCSIRLSPADKIGSNHLDIWLHFDAKYRINDSSDLLHDEDEPSTSNDQSTSRRDDLLKMHAYRDAIRRSAGAYVLYPGKTRADLREYHELLPGLGAFALQPAIDGNAAGFEILQSFLDDVIDHTASRLTQHERGRFWENVAFQSTRIAPRGSAPPFLERPPSDSSVLLGYVKDQSHLAWIKRNGLYNLRADNRNGSVSLGGAELAADVLMLYGPAIETSLLQIVDKPRLLRRDDLIASGYPDPGGSLYFCLAVDNSTLEPIQMPGYSDILTILQDRKGYTHGEPQVFSWQEFLIATLQQNNISQRSRGVSSEMDSDRS